MAGACARVAGAIGVMGRELGADGPMAPERRRPSPNPNPNLREGGLTLTQTLTCARVAGAIAPMGVSESAWSHLRRPLVSACTLPRPIMRHTCVASPPCVYAGRCQNCPSPPQKW